MDKIRDWTFQKIHSHNLVYNTCWEDPRCDRQLMQLQGDSEVVMITSAGCNALEYLLDGPRRVHCIDMNSRQNALLELKKAALRHGDHDELFRMFGEGVHPRIDHFYRESLRGQLPEFARDYWDRKLNFFNGRGLRKSFYHYSTSGTFAWLTNQYLKARRNLYLQVQQLFSADSLEKQAAIYYQVEEKIMNRIVEFFVNRHFTMCLVGVPRSQQMLFREKYERGALGFIQECLRKVFTELPISDNYFWRLYFEGRYTTNCCPAYLEPHHLAPLQDQLDQVITHTNTISGFLRENPGQYSHFVLLDHQDWLADNDRPALEEEWRLILKNSRPGARILLRSAAHKVDFFPDFVHDRVVFEKELTEQTHREDRVGTYASVYLGIVQ